MPFGVRPGSRRAIRAAHRGTALVRMVILIACTGVIVAGVLATVAAGLVIAINGRLP
jgi:hypothetical protein